MSTAYTPPIIGTEYDLDEDAYFLTVTSHARTARAGERIFRAEPWPDIAFRHATQAEANHDAQVLREYLGECASGKRKDRVTAGRKGWWQD